MYGNFIHRCIDENAKDSAHSDSVRTRMYGTLNKGDALRESTN